MLPETLTGACGVYSADMRDSFLVPRRFCCEGDYEKNRLCFTSCTWPRLCRACATPHCKNVFFWKWVPATSVILGIIQVLVYCKKRLVVNRDAGF